MSRSRDLLVTEVAHPRRSARVLARGERETENLVRAHSVYCATKTQDD